MLSVSVEHSHQCKLAHMKSLGSFLKEDCVAWGEMSVWDHHDSTTGSVHHCSVTVAASRMGCDYGGEEQESEVSAQYVGKRQCERRKRRCSAE